MFSKEQLLRGNYCDYSINRGSFKSNDNKIPLLKIAVLKECNSCYGNRSIQGAFRYFNLFVVTY